MILDNRMTVRGGYAAGEVCGDMSTPRLRYGPEILGQEPTRVERLSQKRKEGILYPFYCKQPIIFIERTDYLRESKFKNYDDLPLTLTAQEVGEALGISRAAAYELVRSKGFPHMRIGTRILVPKNKFIQWIEDQTEMN